MTEDKQKLLIEYLISSPDTFAICNKIIKKEYFEVKFQDTIGYIQEYYNKFNYLPDIEQIIVDTGVKLSKQEITPSKIKYCCSEIEDFCKHSAFVTSILHAANELTTKNYDSNYGALVENVRDSLLVSLHNNLGASFFDDYERMIDRLTQTELMQPTGYTKLDEALFGGMNRKEMLLISAGSGGGKSIFMGNIGLNFVKYGLNGVYISLELSEELVYERFLMMTSGYGRTSWKSNIDDVTKKIQLYNKDTRGGLHIVKMRLGTTANDIRSYLKEYELKTNNIPDFVICDYLDLMRPINDANSADTFTKDKFCSEEFRDIGDEYNAYTITASQLNRGAVNADQRDHSHIAGGISKINTTDIYASLRMMLASGELEVYLEKTRSSSGVGTRIPLHIDEVTMRITDPTGINMNSINKRTDKRKSGAVEDGIDKLDKTIIIEESASLTDFLNTNQ